MQLQSITAITCALAPLKMSSDAKKEHSYTETPQQIDIKAQGRTMKALIQRVSQAAVDVDQKTVGKIQRGILLLIGFDAEDSRETLEKMANKILAYRIFPDDEGKMNLSLRDIDGGLLVISQFTLAASTKKGLRPSFSRAAAPAQAHKSYEDFLDVLHARHAHVESGIFAADMKVSLINDGPVTFLLDM